MKKYLLVFLLGFIPFFIKAQCSVQVISIMATCNGSCDGSASAYPIGSGPFTFYWMPGGETTQSINGLCAGTYTIITTDNTNCTSTETFTIVEPPQLMITTSPQAASCQTCCDGYIISTVIGGTPPYSYNWTTVPTQWTSTAQSVCPGTYTVCVTDANGCTNCESANVSFTTAVENTTATGNLSVFPSPASQLITLDETFEIATNVEISVVNVLGQTIYINNLGSIDKLHNSIDVSNFPDGIYLVSVKTENGTQVRKIIKE